MSETLTGRQAATWDDFLSLEDDDRRELIDGVLLEVEVPTGLHEHIVALLIVFLGSWARPRRAGTVLGSGYKVRISQASGFMPDLQFYRIDNPAQPLQQNAGLVRGRPDLVVEVISPSGRRYDRVEKVVGYAAIGVPEYWIVDPMARTLERLVLKDGTYFVADALCDDAVFKPASFEGLEVPLAELWAGSESKLN